MYNEGISKIGDLVDSAVYMEVINKAGALFSYQDQRMQGREGVKNMLTENPKMLEQLNKEVREFLGMDAAPESDVKESGSTNGEAKHKEKDKAKK
jgi:recombination protein RecA